MGLILTNQQFNQILSNLADKYTIYAPKDFQHQGRYSDTNLVRYDTIHQIEEIVFDRKSDMSAKEVVTPINETIMFFFNGQAVESKLSGKEILVFARACDINGFKRLDDIFLNNGTPDYYYQRRRNKIKFIAIECPSGGWDTCFCAAMQTNQTDNYSLAISVDTDTVKIEVHDPDFEQYFSEVNAISCDYHFHPVVENELKFEIPQISSNEVLARLKNHPLWEEYNRRCVMCGSCTVNCPTCSCFTTYDIKYDTDSESSAGERRRMAASCHVDGFSDMAGGHSFRQSAADRMRFKALHKIHDHKQRFGENMCVGCGRCDDRCPEHISFSTMIQKISSAITQIEQELAHDNK